MQKKEQKVLLVGQQTENQILQVESDKLEVASGHALLSVPGHMFIDDIVSGMMIALENPIRGLQD